MPKIEAEKICVVISVHNRIDFTVGCIKSLKKQTVKGFEIVVVDDGSTDGTSEVISKTFLGVILLKGDGNLWWSGATNFGIKYALENDFKYIICLNNDTEVMPDYIEKMNYWAEQNPTALFSSMVYDITTGEPFYVGAKMNWRCAKEEALINKIPKEKFHGLIEVTHLPGRGLWVPAIVFDKIGLFDAKNFPQCGADNDFTIHAAKAGFPLFCNCDAKLNGYTKEVTGSDHTKKFSFKNYYKHLTAINGGANIIVMWRYVMRNCPRRYRFQYIVINIIHAFIDYPASFILSKVRQTLRLVTKKEKNTFKNKKIYSK
jgi:GT2 family glycosyltransferase